MILNSAPYGTSKLLCLPHHYRSTVKANYQKANYHRLGNFRFFSSGPTRTKNKNAKLFYMESLYSCTVVAWNQKMTIFRAFF